MYIRHTDGVKQKPNVPYEPPKAPNRRGDYDKGPSKREKNKAPSKWDARIHDEILKAGKRTVKQKGKYFCVTRWCMSRQDKEGPCTVCEGLTFKDE